MYEVLVFVYENYWSGQACPDRELLGRRLSTAGFEREEIQQALAWLEDLKIAASSLLTPGDEGREPRGTVHHLAPTWPASPGSLRIYTAQELETLAPECVAFIHFLENTGALPPELREVVIDRALAIPATPLGLDDLKIIILMVYWGVGAEPDVLILDELCDDDTRRWSN